ncbi:hypothetical protein ACFSEO_09430 [Agromyces cerinus subsp. nitratus]|uniref:hypothetical protein n=1 Tax=Agromyces cerinus TaxID=33878 RepID=UPI00363034DB
MPRRNRMAARNMPTSGCRGRVPRRNRMAARNMPTRGCRGRVPRRNRMAARGSRQPIRAAARSPTGG